MKRINNNKLKIKNCNSIIFIVFALLIVSSDIYSQFISSDKNNKQNFQNYFTEVDNSNRTFHPNIKKVPGHYTASDWVRAIDSVWGGGINNYLKAQIFQNFWNTIDTKYACFNNLNNVDWSSIRLIYYPLINAGVSAGRFSGIMSFISLSLHDAHTKAVDRNISYNTALDPGVPLFYVGGWYDNSHFGAGLTPMPDSSVFVYDVVPNHPLALDKGDIILGYDRIPYKILFHEMIDVQMPIAGWAIGSSQSAYIHSILNAAGMNWHLFDTIDIKKFTSGDTVHLPTSLLVNKNMNIFCTEQMNIPGVPKPNYTNGEMVSYGIVQGTNTGYIYCWGWSGNASPDFYNAVNALMNTDGLIIDFRFNAGGNMFLSNRGLNALFPYKMNTIRFVDRFSEHDHFKLKDAAEQGSLEIPGTPPGYNKPIAVLTGPGAVSSGDQVALRLKYHPKAKLFGKPTNGAFSSPLYQYLNDGWSFMYSAYNCYELNNPAEYLTRKELPVDYSVWLTPEYVSQGRDNVVEAAINWINETNIYVENNSKYELVQNFPNPFNIQTTIKYQVKTEGFVMLRIYDISGREIKQLVNETQKPGEYYVSFNAANLSSGVYFYRIETSSFVETKKMLMLK